MSPGFWKLIQKSLVVLKKAAWKEERCRAMPKNPTMAMANPAGMRSRKSEASMTTMPIMPSEGPVSNSSMALPYMSAAGNSPSSKTSSAPGGGWRHARMASISNVITSKAKPNATQKTKG